LAPSVKESQTQEGIKYEGIISILNQISEFEPIDPKNRSLKLGLFSLETEEKKQKIKEWCLLDKKKRQIRLKNQNFPITIQRFKENKHCYFIHFEKWHEDLGYQKVIFMK